MKTATIRLANSKDIQQIINLAGMTNRQLKLETRKVKRWVKSKLCVVADAGESILGYAMINHHFYDHSLIEKLGINEESEGRGVVEALISTLEQQSVSTKIFISANESNEAIKSLLLKLEYLPSGSIRNLFESDSDAELIFFKTLDN